MPLLLQLAVLAALALVGWLAAERIRVPAAAFLGPLMFVGASAILGLPQPDFPSWAVMGFQVVFGAFLGCQADRDSVKRVAAMGRPVAVATVWVILSAFVIAFILARMTTVDVTSSFLSAIPGGVAEMSAMSISMKANTAIVATLQSLRVMATMAIIPMVSKKLALPATAGAAIGGALSDPLPVRPPAAPAEDVYLREELSKKQPAGGNSEVVGWLACLGVGLVGAAIFVYLRVPAGAIVGSMAAVVLCRVSGLGLVKPPPLLRLVALLGMGSYVGTGFSDQTLIQLREIAPAAVVVTVATVASGVALARVLRDWVGLDPATALLACAPAGVTQMAVVADEIGADVLVVTLFQLTRLMVCVFVLPVLFSFLV
ncbi:MAG: AbrB family transcriptional regulator [Chloroflexota bacterium]|nr:AbrB family transcriptional regulator [Chloroflexota bacterium]